MGCETIVNTLVYLQTTRFPTWSRGKSKGNPMLAECNYDKQEHFTLQKE